ncbi:flagellar hook-length control protein FliK [uncultured Sphaerotilus sp.]|uniref:flagellar hook-length control protein FliK n=1 Tax=uncultured Sphaerotilus sp. TaxID=474984 RepID=UPI0030CA1EB2
MDSPLLNLAPASTHAAGHAHGRGHAAGGPPDTRADPGGFARLLQAAVAPDATAAADTPALVGEAAPDPGAVRLAGAAAAVAGADTGAAEAPEVAAAVAPAPAAAPLFRRSLVPEMGPGPGSGPGARPVSGSGPLLGPNAVPGPGPGREASKVALKDQEAGAEALSVSVPVPVPAAMAGLVAAVPVAVEAEPEAASAVAPADATDTPARARPRADADAADPADPAAVAATSTTLMQWMLQMAPPAATPVPVSPVAVAPGRLGLGRQEGDGLLQTGLPAGLPGRFELVGQDKAVRGNGAGRSGKLEAARATSAEEPGARSTSGDNLPAIGRKFEVPPATPAATSESTAGAGWVPVPQPAVAPSAGPLESTRVAARAPVDGIGPSAGQDAQVLLSAAQAAANAAAATPTAMSGGGPVVAPAQTWIQTPVTQPGFSDEVVVELVRRAGQAEQGRQEVTLHLNPVEMGPVSVSIELNGSAARIEFGASEALTRHHLEAALPGLTEALRDEGLSLTHSRVHEVSKESLATSAAGGSSSDPASAGGAGSDGRGRHDAFADGRSGFGERAPRRPTELFSIDGRAVTSARESVSIGPSPGRAGRLDLFA